MVSDDHYSETKWVEHKKLVCREWCTAFQLLQLAAKNEECTAAAGIHFEALPSHLPKKAAAPSARIILHVQDVSVELPADLPSDQISEIIRGIRNAG